jgi:sec-independent protein translocase protein TatA
MGISVANLLVILVIVLIIFGAGKLPKVMGDLGKGLRSFRDGLNEKEPKAGEKQIEVDNDNKSNK